MKCPTLALAAAAAAAAAFTTVSAAAVVNNHNQAPLLGGFYAPPPPHGPPVPGNSTLYHCKEEVEGDILTIDRVDISPNPPVPGQNLTIYAFGTTTEDIEQGASVQVEVKYGYIKLISKILDICEHAVQLNLSCPISKGEFILMKEVTLPPHIPPGKYHAFANAVNFDDKPITCVQADMIFKIPHPLL